MKISARNILRGRVVAVNKGATTAHVRLELAGGADRDGVDHQRGGGRAGLGASARRRVP